MPIITFANTKGGAGKTTVAVVLANELARMGHRVALLDSDPQQWISRWHSLAKSPKNLTVISGVTEETIETQVKDLKKRGGYILIDLPGGRTPLLAKAIGLAHHVFVPVQGCAMDAVGGAQILELMKELADKCSIHIDHSVVLTRISSIITTRSMQTVKSLLAQRQVRVLDTALVERAAYRDMFVTGGSLDSMDPDRVSNLDKARENARMFAEEVLKLVPAKTVQTKSAVKAPKSVKSPATKTLKKAA
jgi:chromosome partitioning protein